MKPRPRIPDGAYPLAYEICTEGWNKAVASRLAGVVNDEMWSVLVKQRRSGLCPQLASTAKEIEDVSKRLGEAAGLATLHGLRLMGASRFVQKLGQVIAQKSVPKIWESQTATVARSLRIVGIWLCWNDNGLDSCPCFKDLASDQTKEWIEHALREHLTNLAKPT